MKKHVKIVSIIMALIALVSAAFCGCQKTLDLSKIPPADEGVAVKMQFYEKLAVSDDALARLREHLSEDGFGDETHAFKACAKMICHFENKSEETVSMLRKTEIYTDGMYMPGGFTEMFGGTYKPDEGTDFITYIFFEEDLSEDEMKAKIGAAELRFSVVNYDTLGVDPDKNLNKYYRYVTAQIVENELAADNTTDYYIDNMGSYLTNN